jgi:spore photoproduct lyase
MVSINQVKRYVRKTFPAFGVNKSREVIRLLYEISKREMLPVHKIVNSQNDNGMNFNDLKKTLLKRRYPKTFDQSELANLRLPELNIIKKNCMKIKNKFHYQPKRIFIEKGACGFEVTRKLRKCFPESQVKIIESYSDMLKGKRLGIRDYNKRKEDLFIVKERFHFFQSCPCSPGSVSCQYNLCNLGFGCPFECVYCFLQEYADNQGIVIPANIEDFFAEFKKKNQDLRLGTGEFTDSLAFDHLTGFSARIVEFFEKHPQSIFEFKTKSANVGLLCKAKHAGNIVVGWSLNPQNVINKTEFYSADLQERLAAAQKSEQTGYWLAFHFDPIIFYSEWEKDYYALVENLFSKINPKHVAWISLGCLRMTGGLKQTIENRFPQTTILDEELIPGFDNKLRYSKKVRVMIYQRMKDWIEQFDKGIPLYLCMEEVSLYNDCGLRPFERMYRLGQKRFV